MQTLSVKIPVAYLTCNVGSDFQYTSIKPLGDRVLVKIKTADEKTEGGILLPTTAQTKPQGGEVVAVGEGRSVGKAKVDVCVKVIVLLMLNLLVHFDGYD